MASNGFRPALLFLSSSGVSTTASISARKLSHHDRGAIWGNRSTTSNALKPPGISEIFLLAAGRRKGLQFELFALALAVEKQGRSLGQRSTFCALAAHGGRSATGSALDHLGTFASRASIPHPPIASFIVDPVGLEGGGPSTKREAGSMKRGGVAPALRRNADCVRSAGLKECRSAALHGARKQPWLLLASGRPRGPE